MGLFKKGIAVFVVAGILSVVAYAPALSDDGVEYPEGFRLFDHVKSMIVEPGFMFNGVDLGLQVPGLHHIYGDKQAMEGYRNLNAGGAHQVVFEDGSRIVFDLWQTAEVFSGARAIVEQERLAVAVMEKDSKRYASTGGWGFQVFDPVTKNPLLNASAQHACFSCHKAAAGSDFVFSRLRD